jgi:hypothetical protein
MTNDSKGVEWGGRPWRSRPREVTVETFVVRHQVRQYLRVQGIEWTEESQTGDRVRFGFQATEEQWSDVTAWVEKLQPSP